MVGIVKFFDKSMPSGMVNTDVSYIRTKYLAGTFEGYLIEKNHRIDFDFQPIFDFL